MMRKSEMDGHRRLTAIRRSEFNTGRQPRDSLTADGYRLSIAGGPQSTVKRPQHASNDPRDLQNKSNQKETCDRLLNFLLDNNFREITPKQIMTMTTGLFHEIFGFFIRRILGGTYLAQFGKTNGAEMVVKTMELLEYSFKLVKSSFVNLTRQTFPTALGVLDWLSELVILNELNVEDDLDMERADIDFILDGYNNYCRSGSRNIDIVTDEVVDAVAGERQAELEQVDLDGARKELREQQNEIQSLVSEKRNLENEVIGVVQQCEDYSKHLKLAIYKSEEAKVELQHSKEEEATLKNKLEILKEDIAKLTEKIGDKETAIDLRNRHKALACDLQKWRDSVTAQENDAGLLDVKITRLRDKIDELLIEYNTSANKLGEYSGKFILSSSIWRNNLADGNIKLEEHHELFIKADTLCSEAINKITLELEEHKCENEELDRKLQALTNEHEETMMMFSSKLNQGKNELKAKEGDIASLKTTLNRLGERTLALSQDIRVLLEDKDDMMTNLQEHQTKDVSERNRTTEAKVFNKFLNDIDEGRSIADKQNIAIKDAFQTEIDTLKEQISKEEKLLSDLNSI